jgi:hypothetical protein
VAAGQTGAMSEETDARLEAAILDLLGRRAPGATVCPSDAARAVGPVDGWRELMDPARRAAQRLVDVGEVEVTQGGEVVDLASARGPVRIRRR